MLYYELIKITIDVTQFIDIITNVIVQDYSLLDSISSIEALFLFQSLGYHYVIFQKSNEDFLPPCNHRSIIKVKGLIVS